MPANRNDSERDNETPPPADDCPSASGNPIAYANGQIVLTPNYGTHGGAAFTRPDLPPKPSGAILVSETRYDADGQPGWTIGPCGRIDRTERNRLGQTLRTFEAFGSDAQRVTRFRAFLQRNTRWESGKVRPNH